ncbi:hypothetical protein GEMRC1_008682 [Eukaryota sp. GEM-RC1]
MYTQNKPELGLVNGSKGVIVNVSDTYIDVRFNAEAEPKRISQSRFAIEHLNEIGRPVQVAKRIQFPLRPCWAITVHRSQGLTIDGIEVAIQFWEYAQLYVTLSRVRSWRSLKILSIGRSYPVPNLELYQWYYSTFHPVKPSTIDLYVLGNQHCLQRDFNHFHLLIANFCAESSVSVMDDVVVPEDVHCVDEVVDEVIVDNVDEQIIDLDKNHVDKSNLFETEALLSGPDSGDESDSDTISTSLDDFVVNDELEEDETNIPLKFINCDSIFNKNSPEIYVKKSKLPQLPRGNITLPSLPRLKKTSLPTKNLLLQKNINAGVERKSSQVFPLIDDEKRFCLKEVQTESFENEKCDSISEYQQTDNVNYETISLSPILEYNRVATSKQLRVDLTIGIQSIVDNVLNCIGSESASSMEVKTIRNCYITDVINRDNVDERYCRGVLVELFHVLKEYLKNDEKTGMCVLFELYLILKRLDNIVLGCLYVKHRPLFNKQDKFLIHINYPLFTVSCIEKQNKNKSPACIAFLIYLLSRFVTICHRVSETSRLRR